jgi:hypothetical protein
VRIVRQSVNHKRLDFLFLQNDWLNISLDAFGVDSHVSKDVRLDLLCISIDISSVLEMELQTFFGK